MVLQDVMEHLVPYPEQDILLVVVVVLQVMDLTVVVLVEVELAVLEELILAVMEPLILEEVVAEQELEQLEAVVVV